MYLESGQVFGRGVDIDAYVHGGRGTKSNEAEVSDVLVRNTYNLAAW